MQRTSQKAATIARPEGSQIRLRSPKPAGRHAQAERTAVVFRLALLVPIRGSLSRTLVWVLRGQRRAPRQRDCPGKSDTYVGLALTMRDAAPARSPFRLPVQAVTRERAISGHRVPVSIGVDESRRLVPLSHAVTSRSSQRSFPPLASNGNGTARKRPPRHEMHAVSGVPAGLIREPRSRHPGEPQPGVPGSPWGEPRSGEGSHAPLVRGLGQRPS